ncbi:MAG: SDR family NAD(P)-dependent oxidoreductase [Halieaceae bacterium]|nr:SDR family NAD(P)-dependent oxidoreductase [Halieaceae bacterium]MCP5146514.1 SDR family NAD(P)-dependent oxidoreductase [Pseudomonadales bacterium]MCP5166418.1 SDR family NAD(P)-dependent oxidoreductase [Pseudomonadales bacterium]MCP5186312.1 SDR family NAD(P)-dependent oxidoreductase [Pseudomonadales bacterium]
MKNLFDVAGKVAVVTGGSRGIGAMIARGFVESGVKTYITARKEEELQATAAELSQLGECIALPSNLGDLEGVAAFAAAIREREPQLHILVNNAGASWGAGIDEFPESGWDKVMDLNVKSLFFLTQQLLPALRSAATADDPARVINIGSVNGVTHSHMNNYSYSASKAAVHHLTRHLGADLAVDNINVNAIAPGFFPSKMTAHLLPHEAELAKGIPRGRLGREEDAAGTAIYLSSRASAWVTGNIICLDGGHVAAA